MFTEKIFAATSLLRCGSVAFLFLLPALGCSERPPEAELAKRVLALLGKMPADEVVYMKMIGSKEPGDLSPREAAVLVVAIDELKAMAEQLVRADPGGDVQPFTLAAVNTYSMPAVIRGYQAGTYMRFIGRFRYPRTDVDYIEYKNHVDELGKDKDFRESVREKVLSEEQLDEYETLFDHLRDIDSERAYLRSIKK